MSAANSTKAQKLAEELLGLDAQSSLPEHAAYQGKYNEGVKAFYRKNKKVIMYVGGAVVIGGIAYIAYKMYKKHQQNA
jgi:hypothetical protein